jgi:polyhydroxybutyrate depolymerase
MLNCVRSALLMVCLLFICSAGVIAVEPADLTFKTFRYTSDDGASPLERKYLLYLPQNLPPNAPLVFVLHGYHGDARDYMGEISMNTQAATHGFAVCFPQGSDDFEGVPHWNARLQISKTNDIEFLSKLALNLQKRHKLSPRKTFVCGVSNGGFMSYTLVAEKPDIFKAAASIIGSMSGTTWKNRSNCKPVSILQMTGMHDEVVPYDGSMSEGGGWGGAPDHEQIIKFWSDLADAKQQKVVELTPKTTVRYYRGEENGIEVWFYQIKKMRHVIPNKKNAGIDVPTELWRFFSRF